MLRLIRRLLDPPTKNQLNYAKKLGIDRAGSMSKADLSKAIDAATAVQKAEKLEKKQRKTELRKKKAVATFGQDAVAEETKWQKICDSTDFNFVILKRGKNLKAEILVFESAFLDERGKVVLNCSGPKKFKEDGEVYLEWDKDVSVEAIKIVHYAEAPNLDSCEPAEYEKVLASALEIAEQLKKKS